MALDVPVDLVCGCEGFLWLAATLVAAVGQTISGSAVVSEVCGWQVEFAARAAFGVVGVHAFSPNKLSCASMYCCCAHAMRPSMMGR